jgi:hypothetical protein
MGLRIDRILFESVISMEKGQKKIVCSKKKKESCQFFPNKGLFLLVLCSYLKIMNCVCIGILGAATEIAFSGYIFLLPHPFHKSFYLV